MRGMRIGEDTLAVLHGEADFEVLLSAAVIHTARIWGGFVRRRVYRGETRALGVAA